MGHGVNAAWLATLMVGGLRNARRAGVELAEQARIASDGLADHAPQVHPREPVQHLTQAIFEATGGRLVDDATAMCLDWHGGPTRSRNSKLRGRSLS